MHRLLDLLLGVGVGRRRVRDQPGDAVERLTQVSRRGVPLLIETVKGRGSRTLPVAGDQALNQAAHPGELAVYFLGPAAQLRGDRGKVLGRYLDKSHGNPSQQLRSCERYEDVQDGLPVYRPPTLDGRDDIPVRVISRQ